MVNFDLSEFRCRHCGQVKMDEAFLTMLDQARTLSGVPYTINSGFRCQAYNTAIGSTTQNHPSGKAADIKCLDMWTRLRILTGLIMAGFKRIGIHKEFIHADTFESAPKGVYLY